MRPAKVSDAPRKSSGAAEPSSKTCPIRRGASSRTLRRIEIGSPCPLADEPLRQGGLADLARADDANTRKLLEIGLELEVGLAAKHPCKLKHKVSNCEDLASRTAKTGQEKRP